MPRMNEWIPWDGDEHNAPPDFGSALFVSIEYRDGDRDRLRIDDTTLTVPAYWGWMDDPDDGDVVAYRLEPATITDQPPPKPSSSPAIWDLVIADMRERDHVGRERYGTPLQANNGRDALVDAYQESLDLAVYLRQAIYERDNPKIPDDGSEPIHGKFRYCSCGEEYQYCKVHGR